MYVGRKDVKRCNPLGFKSQNLNMELAYDPNNSTSRSVPCAQMIIRALFIISKRWKLPKFTSADDWRNKIWYISTMELKIPRENFIQGWVQ